MAVKRQLNGSRVLPVQTKKAGGHPAFFWSKNQ
jgi:hypothetical protein